jgi:hypothetical protein
MIDNDLYVFSICVKYEPLGLVCRRFSLWVQERFYLPDITATKEADKDGLQFEERVQGILKEHRKLTKDVLLRDAEARRKVQVLQRPFRLAVEVRVDREVICISKLALAEWERPGHDASGGTPKVAGTPKY